MLWNILINLRAGGVAAVTITWLLCVTAIALWGRTTIAGYIGGALAVMGGLLVKALMQEPRKPPSA